MESLKCMSPEKCARILQSGPVFNFRVSFVLCLFLLFFTIHSKTVTNMMKCFFSMCSTHYSDPTLNPDLALQPVSLRTFMMLVILIIHIYIYSSFGPVFNLLGVTAAIGCSSVV